MYFMISKPGWRSENNLLDVACFGSVVAKTSVLIYIHTVGHSDHQNSKGTYGIVILQLHVCAMLWYTGGLCS